jgi:hypothetical protein
MTPYTISKVLLIWRRPITPTSQTSMCICSATQFEDPCANQWCEPQCATFGLKLSRCCLVRFDGSYHPRLVRLKSRRQERLIAAHQYARPSPARVEPPSSRPRCPRLKSAGRPSLSISPFDVSRYMVPEGGYDVAPMINEKNGTLQVKILDVGFI